MTNQAPYRHADGSNCWTKNCSRGHQSDAPQFEVPSFYRPELFPKPKAPTPGAWTNKDTVLFKTIHGSRLYGLGTPDSDEDWYVVTPTRYIARKVNAKQTIIGDQDVVAVDFRSFTALATKGVPQALEAMFSCQAESPYFEDYRNNWYASDGEVIHTYMRTIKSFSLNENEGYMGFKQRRHSLRLAINLEELLYTGRFNPTLPSPKAARITHLAEKTGNSFIKELKAISPIEVDWKFQGKQSILV
jgi:hypothetical protein